MAGTLDYVKRGEAITAEKWNALVERINALEQRQTFDFRAPRKGGGGVKVALAQILWNWSKRAGESVYSASAHLVEPATKAVDESKSILVYSSSGYRSGTWNANELRWIASVGGVWQLIDTYNDTQPPSLSLLTETIYRGISASIDNSGGLHFVLNNSKTINYYGT